MRRDKRSTERTQEPGANLHHEPLEKLMAEVDGCFTAIEEMYLPEICSSLEEIKMACQAGWEAATQMQKQLGFFDYAR